MTELAKLGNNKIAITAGNITVFNFDARTGEFICSCEEYLLVGVGLPAHSTDLAPDTAADGYVSIFTDDGWSLQEDHRGKTVYSISDRSASQIDYIGAIADGFVTIAPVTQYDEWNGRAWVVNADAQHAVDANTAIAQQKSLRALADSQIAWRQDAVDAEIATQDETDALIEWKKYRVQLMRVDTSSAPNISWPAQPAS